MERGQSFWDGAILATPLSARDFDEPQVKTILHVGVAKIAPSQKDCPWWIHK